jgi:hypothetical protein
MEKHVTVVGALRIGFGALGILVAIFVFALLVGIGALSGDREARPILTFVGLGVGLFLGVLSVPGIIGGIGLLKLKPWARYLVLIVSVLDLLNIPIGTAVGAYSIWVLMQDETAQLFAAGSSQ